MSAVAAKRGRRKMLKPKVSLGSSSGASSNLPRNIQRRLPERHAMQKSVKEDQALEHQPLTESNVNDIISHLRRVPEENGPSLEPRWVLAEYDMLTFFLDPDARFTQLHERLHSFIYHEDPDYECDCYSHSCPTVPLADLCDGLSTTALGAKMAVIACDETGEPACGAGGSVSMQKNKANAARYCYMSPCRYLPEVDTDDTVKIWCSRSQPSQVTQCGSRAWMVEVEQERSSSSGSEYDQLDEEVQDEEGSRESRDDENDGLPVNRAVRYAASVGGGHRQVLLRPHQRHWGNAPVQSTKVHRAPPPAGEQLGSLGGLAQPKLDNGAPGHHGAAASGPAP